MQWHEVESATPLVSVVAPVYNQEPSELSRAFGSIIAQTLPQWELIISDDGTTNPATLDYLDSLPVAVAGDIVPSARLRFVGDGSNHGVVAARNRGLAVAEGRYVCFLDPDDWLSRTFLEKAVLLLESRPSVDIVAPTVVLQGHAEHRYWQPEELAWPEIRRDNQIPISSVVRRSALEGVGGFRDEFSVGWEDWDLWLRLAAQGSRSLTLREPLFVYSYSETEGRDAEVNRPNHSGLRKLIGELAPRTFVKPPPLGQPQPIGDLIRSTPVNLSDDSKRSVVFFVPWLTREGGAEAFIRQLTEGLGRAGFELFVVATHGDEPSGCTDGIGEMLELTPNVYRLNTLLDAADHEAFVARLISSLDDPVLVCVGSRLLYDHLEASKERKARKVIDILFNDVGHMDRHLELSDRFTDVVLVHPQLERTLRAAGPSQARSHSIPVAIPESRRSSVRRPLEGRRPIVGWLGRLSEEKRPEWFVDLARSCGHLADFRLAGTGPMMSAIAARGTAVESLSILGFVESAHEFLEGLDVLVNTSLIEGISLSAMEALQLGVPVVASDVGGMGELLIDGENGYLLDPECFSSFEATLRYLLGERELLADLQDNVETGGLADHFLPHQMIESYLALLDDSEDWAEGRAWPEKHPERVEGPSNGHEADRPRETAEALQARDRATREGLDYWRESTLLLEESAAAGEIALIHEREHWQQEVRYWEGRAFSRKAAIKLLVGSMKSEAKAGWHKLRNSLSGSRRKSS